MLRKSRFVLLAALFVASYWAALPVYAANQSKNPCAGNPCTAKNPCGANPCTANNPCAAKNPCAAQKPGAANNPCAAKNACARSTKSPGSGNQLTPPSGVGTQAKSSKPAITDPPHFYTLKRDASVKDAVARGRKLFRSIGCVSCHPRGRTIRGTAVDVTGVRHPVPIPTLIGAAEHFPRLNPVEQVANVGQFNDWCATTFIGNPPMDSKSQDYKDLEAYVVSLSPARYKRMLEWEAKRKAFMKTVQPTAGGGNPGGSGAGEPKIPVGNAPVAKNPCAPQNPPAAKNPCAGQNPPASNNPCAAKNPCANNPCAARNPCAKK